MKKIISTILVMLLFSASAHPQTEKQIKILVPFPAGGSTDAIARIIAEGLDPILGSPVLIENKSGAGGSIATKDAAKSPADGSVLLMSTVSTFGSNHAFMRDPGFHPINDFRHVITVASTPRVLVVRSDFPADNIQELVTLIKKHPNKYIFGTSGKSADELYVTTFNQLSGTQTIFVPYKGGSHALVDLLGKHTDILIDNLPLVLQYVHEGRLKLLAISWHHRLADFPNVPTWGELGYHDMNISSWQGIVVPHDTPESVVYRINKLVRQVLNEGKTQKRLLRAGFYPVNDTPEQSKKLAQDTYQKMTDIGKKNKIIKD